MKLHRRPLVSVLLAGLFLVACTETPEAVPCDVDLVDRIDMERTLSNLRVLSEDIGPRGASSPQEREAAEYLATELEGYGYEVEIQEFSRTQVVSTIEVTSPADLRIYPATGRVQGLSSDEYPLLTPEEGLTGRIVDCGPGECPPEVDGQIALISQGENSAAPLLAQAAEAGARAVILHGTGWRRHLAAVQEADAAIPFVTVNGETGDAIRESGEVEVTLHVNRFDTSQNVIATRPVEGRPDAPVVVFSAHYDSVEQAPGANDNGSGTVGLLEMARIYAQVEADVELRFVAVGAEEVGLLGARHYVAELSEEDRSRIVANFNTDMIGTAGEDQTQLYVNTLDGDNLVARTARVAREQLGLPEEMLRAPYQRGASDHVAFHDGGIPAANFIWRHPDTADLEPWYHQPHDRMDRISEDRLRTAISIVLLASRQVICENAELGDEAPAGEPTPDTEEQPATSAGAPGSVVDTSGWARIRHADHG